MIQVPKRIADAAQKRIYSLEARKMQAKVAKAFAQNEPANAEPDANRRFLRVQAVTGTDADHARQLLGGENPANFLAGDDLYGAERLIGETVDFLPVSFLTVGQGAASSVGRVIERTGEPIGSGFLISGRLFLTNNHVIGSPEDAGRMLLEFDYETDPQSQPRPTTRFALDPGRFFLTNDKDDLDFTVVAVGERTVGSKEVAEFGFCPLSDRGDKHMLGEFVNIVQHPQGDYKQVVLREDKLVSRLDTVLHYEADTEPGSSGSPVFNDEWEAVALHHWGGPHREQRTREGQPVPAAVNEGIRISAIVKALLKVQPAMSAAQQALLKDALDAGNAQGRRPLPISAGESQAPAKSPQSLPVKVSEVKTPTVQTNSDGSVTVSLEVNMKLAGALGDAGTRGGEEKLPPNPDYSNRPGYDPSFLPDFPLPIPEVTDRAPGSKAKLLHPPADGDPYELKYEHFSIVVNSTRKFPFVTAANIDGAASKKVDRRTGLVVDNTEGDGDESAEAGEKWYVDPRIAAKDQTNQSLYDHQQPRVFDRGHQVRREDPVWGDNDAAESANADTFHFTNCCPQEYRFNEQVRYWAGIENYVLDNTRAEKARASVFTGPVFAATDPPYRGVRAPLQFFKVIARVEGGELKATAFLASQAELLSNLPERLSRAEGFSELGRVREYLTTVAEIEKMTGLDFGPLREHDTNAVEALGQRRPLLADSDLRAALGGRPRATTCRAPAKPERLVGAEATPAFSADSLSVNAFDWNTALSTALASQLAYSDEATVEAKATNEWGLQSCKFISIKDTQCFVAATSDTALVSFRGTESVRDWLANLDVLATVRMYGRIHRGFFRAFEDVQERVLQVVAALNKPRVIATGHSLGGALATVFAAEAPPAMPIKWIYTFGQPRVGIGNDYVSALNGRYGKSFVRFVNDDDIVPRVPPLPYCHVGRLMQFDADGNVNGNPERLAVVAAPDFANGPPPLTEAEFRDFQAKLRSDREVARAEAAEGILPSISDHAIAKYIAKIAAQEE
jgi:endonuclease G, mitochondrial